jgi:hypothetical protein
MTGQKISGACGEDPLAERNLFPQDFGYPQGLNANSANIEATLHMLAITTHELLEIRIRQR